MYFAGFVFFTFVVVCAIAESDGYKYLLPTFRSHLKKSGLRESASSIQKLRSHRQIQQTSPVSLQSNQHGHDDFAIVASSAYEETKNSRSVSKVLLNWYTEKLRVAPMTTKIVTAGMHSIHFVHVLTTY